MNKFIASFSGGKDCTLAIYNMIKQGWTCEGLIVAISNGTSSIHQISLNILRRISDSWNIPIYFIEGDWRKSLKLKKIILTLKAQGVTHFVFGDIKELNMGEFSNIHWHNELSIYLGIKILRPLFNKTTLEVIEQFLDSDFKSIIKVVDRTKIGSDFLGKELTPTVIKEFKKLNIDICGENGEYHTLIFDGPLFHKSLDLVVSNKIEKQHNSMNYVVLKVELAQNK